MSNNPSHTTDAIALRIPKEVYAILKRKAKKQGIKPSEWLKRRMIYDITRRHGNGKSKKAKGTK